MTEVDQIAFNKQAHDKVASSYERVHTEIFNPHEQARLYAALREAVTSITSTSTQPTVLDVGSGSGNLTQLLVKLGLKVTAADISQVFLDQIQTKHTSVQTHMLNGTDLAELADGSFDMVATYSVLHHIPDYKLMVREMCRVLKPGGVLYIDHEKNDRYWKPDPLLTQFYRSQRWSMLPSQLRKLVTPMWYVHRWRRLKDPRYQAEGDIHVWPDDHIVWDEMIAICTESGVRVVRSHEFLLFDSRYNQSAYTEAAKTLADTRAVIFRKHD